MVDTFEEDIRRQKEFPVILSERIESLWKTLRLGMIDILKAEMFLFTTVVLCKSFV